MRSAPTARPSTRDEPPSARPHDPLASIAKGALALLLLSLALVACVSNSAPDQLRAQRRDATRASILPQLQDTQIARRFAATPSPIPPHTPIPTLETLVLTVGINADGSPQQAVSAISSGQASVYAAALIHDLRPGEKVIASWRTVNLTTTATAQSGNTEVASSQVVITSDTDVRWFDFALTAPLPSGTYAVWIYVNDQVLNSLVFQVN